MTDTTASDLPELQRLKQDPLLGTLPRAAIARLLGRMEPVHLEPGSILYHAGEESVGLWLLEDGHVSLITADGQARQTLSGFIRVGDEALCNCPRLVKAEILTDCTGWVLPTEALQTALRERPELATRAANNLAALMSGARQFSTPAAAPAAGDTNAASKTQIPSSRPTRPTRAASVMTTVGWTLMLLVPPLVYLLCVDRNLSVQSSIFCSILSAMILLWIFELVDEFVPPVLAMVAILFVGLAPTSVAMGGFSSPTLMTLLGIFALAAAVSTSGLSLRVLLWLLTRLPNRPASHRNTFLGVGVLLSQVVSSQSSRLTLMMPAYRDCVENLRYVRQSRLMTALFISTMCGATMMAALVVTGKSSNMAGMALLPEEVREQYVGLKWLWGAGMAAVVLFAAHLLVTRWMVKGLSMEPPSTQSMRLQLQALGPMSGREKSAAAGFMFLMVGMLTQPLHQIQPPWLAGSVLVGLLMSGAMTRMDFQRRIEWTSIMLLLATDSVMRVMNYLGLQETLATTVGAVVGAASGQPYLFVAKALLLTMVVRLVLQGSSGFLVSSVILLPLAANAGLSPWCCIFLVALFSEIVLLPYQNQFIKQLALTGEFEEIDSRLFWRHIHLSNLARVVAGFASVPWWQWLGLT